MTDITASFDTKGLFPTLVHFRDVKDPEEMNAKMLQRIRTLQGEDPTGLTLSNEPGLGGWHSKNVLQNDPAFSDLRALIGETMRRVVGATGLDTSFNMALTEMWSIVNPPLSYNKAHLHPNHHFSGVYYIQAPDACGNLMLLDPRIEAKMMPLKFSEAGADQVANMVTIPVRPKPGRMVLFPSWLLHRVEPNLTKAQGQAADRVIVSFNLRQIPPQDGGAQ